MVRCETCNKEHDGKYASGRFCSRSCSNSFSTKLKRSEINDRVAIGFGGPTEIKILESVKKLLADNEYATLGYLSLNSKTSYCRLKNIINKHGIILKKKEKSILNPTIGGGGRKIFRAKERADCYVCGREFVYTTRKKN